MAKLSTRAFNVLTMEEQSSLSLKHVEQKSSWQGGEIMGKAHYKYLEISYRADFFLKRFTEYFEMMGDTLLPTEVKMDIKLRRYFEGCILERKKPHLVKQEVYVREGSPHHWNWEIEITKFLAELEKGKTQFHEEVFHMIKDFDRWNNQRILPIALQEPSAYKRRNKNTHKKHLRVITTVHELSAKKIKQVYAVTKKTPIVLPFMTQSGVIRIYYLRGNIKTIKAFSELGIYLFPDMLIATKYMAAIQEFLDSKKVNKKSCKGGLKFWPIYRDMIKESINYAEVQKIIPTRKYLNVALSKAQFI